MTPGWSRAQCSDLRGHENSGLAVRLAVPPGFEQTESDGPSCTFVRSFARDLSVSVGPFPSLLTQKEHDVDPFTSPGQGDGQLGEVSYAADVPVFGRHRGERLDYFCYRDGQNLQEHVLQAADVRVEWTTPHGRSDHAAQLTTLTGSVALVRSRASTCAERGGITVRYRPPIPQTESIDRDRGRCHLYLRPGRASLNRYAEIVAGWPADPPTG